MTWATKWIWIAVLLAGGVQAGAYVNPIDQSLSVSHTDASGKSLKISRNFNSMRTKAGIFGSGWCSIWESSLKLKATGAEFNFCGMGKTIGFSNRGGRWISADTAYRFNADAKGYSVQMGFRDSFYFDKSGRLQSIQADATRFNISYAGGKIAIIEGAGEKAVFTFAGDRVATIQIGGETAAYTYAKENLTGVKRSSATAFAYSYNSHGQLTKIRGAQGSDELKYEYKGRAIASVEWKDCEEIISPNSSKPVTAVEVKKICKGKPPEIRTFAIKGVSRESGLTVNETEGKDTFERTWKKNRLIEHKSEGYVTGFTYDNNGMMKEMKRKNWELSVLARSSGYPERLLIKDKSGKKVKTETLNLKWSKGRLAQISSKSAQFNVSSAPGSTRFQSKAFDLTLTSQGGSTTLGGSWRGEKLAPFAIGKDLNSYSEPQLQAMGAATSLAQLKSQVESL